jgi:hypothetical protein
MAVCFYLELSLSRRAMTSGGATRWGAQAEVEVEHEVEVETKGEREPRDRGRSALGRRWGEWEAVVRPRWW